MDMASLPTGIGSPANRRRRALVEDPVAKHGPFFLSLPEVAAAETVMSGAAALWSSAARCRQAEPLPAPPATAEPLPAPPATAAPATPATAEPPAPPAHHGRAPRRPRPPEPSPTTPARCLASPRAARPSPRRPRRAPPRPSQGRTAERRPTTPRASPRAPGAAPRYGRRRCSCSRPRRGRGEGEGARMPHLDGRARAAIASVAAPRRPARSPTRAAPARTLLDVEVLERGARGGCWNEARTVALSGLAVAPLPRLGGGGRLVRPWGPSWARPLRHRRRRTRARRRAWAWDAGKEGGRSPEWRAERGLRRGVARRPPAWRAERGLRRGN
nr:uncharacterized protein LOC127338284 [Lolium perenne]